MKLIPLLFLLPGLALAKDLPTLGDYENDDRRPAPTELIGGDVVKQSKAKKEVEEILSNFDKKQQKRMREYLSAWKDYERQLSELKRLKSTMPLTEKGKYTLSTFFWRKGNGITCRGIEITDAAQSFENGEIWLTIKFIIWDKKSSSYIPENFLNSNVRRAFAVYSTAGTESAFYRGDNESGEQRYKRGKEYRARYITALGSGKILSDIRCAHRRMPNDLLDPDGEYRLISDY